MLRLIKNKIRCKTCGDIIESRTRHEFVRCKCGRCFVDGGTDYSRKGYFSENLEDSFEDLSVYIDENCNLVQAKDILKEEQK